jgi:hypothetical protein
MTRAMTRAMTTRMSEYAARLQRLPRIQAPAPELPAHRQSTGVQVARAELGEGLVGWRGLADGIVSPAECAAEVTMPPIEKSAHAHPNRLIAETCA